MIARTLVIFALFSFAAAARIAVPAEQQAVADNAIVDAAAVEDAETSSAPASTITRDKHRKDKRVARSRRGKGYEQRYYQNIIKADMREFDANTAAGPSMTGTVSTKLVIRESS